MTVAATCPECGSLDTRYREQRGGWICDACDHVWAEPPLTGDTEPKTLFASFISYGHADASGLAERLRQDLMALGASVWLDADGIEAGGQWDIRIEQGVRSADVLLAVMTPHSVREDSVCRDEVILAHTLGKSIVPVRASSDPAVRPTLLLVRKSWLDFTGDYEEAFGRLVRVLTGDESALFKPLAASVAGLVPIDFGPELARHTSVFVGRDWLDRELDDWLADEAGRAFVIVGEPGIGKSAIAAHIATTRADVAAVHFCTIRNSRTLDPYEFVAAVTGQLSGRVSGFADAMEVRNPEVPRERAGDAFRELVVEPARRVPRPESTQILVVDSLDEAATRAGETIADLLLDQAPDLPPWLRVVATTRPESEILERLRALSTFELQADRPENTQDLAEFVHSRLVDERAANRVAALAEGNFLYAHMATEALAAGTITAEELAGLPAGVSDYLAVAFRRAFPSGEEYSTQYAPILRCLIAAFAPVPEDVLRRAVGSDRESLSLRIRVLRPYLRVEGPSGQRCFALYHRSVSEWLQDAIAAGPYFCDSERGHADLADALNEDESAREYRLRWLPQHLRVLRRWDALYSFLSSIPTFIELDETDSLAPRRLWADLKLNGHTAAEAYAENAGRLNLDASQLLAIAELLSDLDEGDRAIDLYLRARDLANVDSNPSAAAAAASGAAIVFRSRGRLSEAMEVFGAGPAERLEVKHSPHTMRLYRELELGSGVGASTWSPAMVLMDRGEFDRAVSVLETEISHASDVGDAFALMRALGNLSLVRLRMGDAEAALATAETQEEICRSAGDMRSLCLSLGNRACVLHVLGRNIEALESLAEQEALCQRLQDERTASLVELNRGIFLCASDGAEIGLPHLQRSEQICRSIGDLSGTFMALGYQAAARDALGDGEEALRLFELEETICRQLSACKGLGISLDRKARLLAREGSVEEALRAAKEAVECSIKLGSPTREARELLVASLSGESGAAPGDDGR